MLQALLTLFFSFCATNSLSCCKDGQCWSVDTADECLADLSLCIDSKCEPLKPHSDDARRCCPVFDGMVLPDVCTLPVGEATFGEQVYSACESGSIPARCPLWTPIEPDSDYYACGAG